VLFLGDAAAQHSPFGARGGNRAIQDANNLGWKLALVLAGRAHANLLLTCAHERHRAAREAVEIAALRLAPQRAIRAAAPTKNRVRPGSDPLLQSRAPSAR
jgi:3-(3-hydroxy-phenyl)propionate hydroxylase